jgi:hypothetical protein
VSWFLELEENLALIGKITLSFLCPGDRGGVPPIFILGGEFLALMPVLFRQIRICSEMEIGFDWQN